MNDTKFHHIASELILLFPIIENIAVAKYLGSLGECYLTFIEIERSIFLTYREHIITLDANAHVYEYRLHDIHGPMIYMYILIYIEKPEATAEVVII